MDKSEIMVENVGGRPVRFEAKCPICGITEEAISHATVKKDKPEMELLAHNLARNKIVRHLKEKHGIEIK